MSRIRTFVVALIAVAAVGVAMAASASADYGPGAQYQIELSANISGTSGGGAWLWITLNSNGTGDYTGSDCGHKTPHVGAAPDAGNVTWTKVQNPDGTYELVIDGVVLNGLGDFATTITVPADYGHYTGTIGTYLTLPPFIPPNVGNSQLQVAP